MGNWNRPVGLNHVGAYQVSGAPWASGSIDCKMASRPGGFEVVFPYVTRWIKVINKDVESGNVCKVAFSLTGMTGSAQNYFTVSEAAAGWGYGDSGELEMKVSSIWISGSTDVDVVAGLTSIEAFRTQTPTGSSWSGSSGVS